MHKNHNKQCTRYSKRPEDLRLRSSERKKNAIQLDIDSYKNEIYFICYYSVNMCTGPQGNGKKGRHTEKRESNNNNDCGSFFFRRFNIIVCNYITLHYITFAT